MGIINKLKERYKEIEFGATGIVEHLKVSSDLRSERLKTCRSCEHFWKSTDICSICKCYMPAKTWVSIAECPIQKWGKSDKE